MNRKDAGFASVNQQTVLLLAEPQVRHRQRVPQIPLGIMIQLYLLLGATPPDRFQLFDSADRW
jgi:hypothetical protein